MAKLLLLSILIRFFWQSYSRLMRVSSEAEKEEWMEKLKERATGSLADRRKLSVAAVTGENSKVCNYMR